MAAPADRNAVEQAVARGSDALKAGRLDEAQAAFRTALAADGDNPRVLALLGLAHFRASNFEGARAIYEELVERLPTDASHRLNLGLVYLKLGDAGKAIHSLEASRALDPSQGRAVSYLGLAYARAGRYPEAYRSFLLAGQTDLANEIEGNLTPAERDGIRLQVTPVPMAVPAAPAPPPVAPEPPRTLTPSRLSVATPPLGVMTAEAEVSDDDIEVETDIAAESRATTGEITTPTQMPPSAPTAPTGPAGPSNGIPQPPSDDPSAPRLTDSLQFVLPTRSGPQPIAGRSRITHAVEVASPSAVATATVPRAQATGTPAIPLSQLATDDLVRPDDGDDPFELSASGALIIRVTERVLTRLDGVHVTGGDLTFERATRRSRGHQTEERFDYGGSQLHSVTGRGYLIAVPPAGDKRTFTAVALDDDIFYLREDLVFAFAATLRWENGNVPGLRGRLPVVQFRGDGAVAIRSERPLVRVKLLPHNVVFVDAARLAGWIGRVIPRAVVPPSGGPMGDVCVECTGEGVVLVDPIGDPGLRLSESATALAAAQAAAKPKAPPPTPRASRSEAELDLGSLTDDVPPGRDEF